MNALVKKEIRLLLPGFLAILLLETVQPWIWNEADETFAIAPVIFFFGMIIFAVDSFGREFSLGTFQSLLSQPIERRQIWRTKITVLLFGAALIFAAYFASCELRLHEGLKNPLWHAYASKFNATIIENNFSDAMFASVAVLFVAVMGGLWTALLFRQIATAFWITFLIPAGLMTTIIFFLPSKLADNEHFVTTLLYSLAGIYVVAGFWLAHKLFQRAQDVAWTGGIISFSTWRYFEARSRSSVSERRWKPVSALLKKEFQLHSISLFGAGALLALHIGIFFLRAFYANFHKNSLAAVASDFFWVLWLVMPLTIGSMAVAEERKLGVAEQQFCLSASRRLQFAVKFVPAMIFGVLLGGIMPLLLETIAAHLGAPNEIFTSRTHEGNVFGNGLSWFEISIVALSAGFALAGFFGSAIARNFLQALSIAIVTLIGCSFFVFFVEWVNEQRPTFFGITPWHSILPILIAFPTVPAALTWLAYLNFNHFHESRRLWRRNIVGIAAMLIFIIGGSAAIYNRAWEIFEPAEPPHGAAKFSFSNPPKLSLGSYENLLVQFPDGRVWTDNLREPIIENRQGRWRQLLETFLHPLPASVGPKQFIGGSNSSNWVSATVMYVDWWESTQSHVTGYLDTTGVKSDGTLWISEKSEPKIWTGANMIRFGDETNWRQIAWASSGRLLLKNDGTLWFWGTNSVNSMWNGWRTNWPSVRAFQPRQIGTNSDWKEISPVWWMRCAEKTDGTVWRIDEYNNAKEEISRETNRDGINLKTFSSEDNSSAYVGEDGTLWIRNHYLDKSENTGDWKGEGFLQVGKETNWLAVFVTLNSMVALKSDGTLWRWNFPADSPRDAAKIPPMRFDIHNDWIALTSIWGGGVSLAADGSLWFWPGGEFEEMTLLKFPKQPGFLGNVFGKPD